MQYLRKNTAIIVTVGPFYDKTDGVTIEGSLTITNERITLTADTDDGSAPTNILDNVTGATSGTSNDLNYITGNDAGFMQLELTASNTNRLGRMRLSITDAANHCPVNHEYMVIPEPIYDALFSAGATYGDVLVTTTIATLASQVSFTLTAGSADNDAYNGARIVVTDATTNTQKAVGLVNDYTGSTKTIALAADPAVFTMAVGDRVEIMASPMQLPAQVMGVAGGLPSFSQVNTIDDFLDTEIAAILAAVDTEIATLVTAVQLLQGYTKNVAVTGFGFAMYLTDGTLATGVTITGTISKDKGNFASLGDAPAEIQTSGCYECDISQTEMNADEILLKFTGTGCKPLVVKIRTQG